MFRSIALSAAIAAACMPAAAQLIKCAGPDGRVTYSDRPCQVGEKRAEVKAPPIPEPTRQEVLDAEIRRQNMNEQAAAVDRRRARAPIPGAVGIVATPDKGSQRVGTGHADRDKCAGVRREIRRAKFMNPTGYEREVTTLDLQRAERSFCAE